MYLWIFNYRSTCQSNGLHNLILRFPEWPFSGLASETDPPPVSLHLLSGTAGIWPLLFFFTKCISKPWIFSCTIFSAVYDLESLLMALLLRVLSRLNVSNIIGGGSKVFGKYFQLFLRNLTCLSRPISSGISALLLSPVLWLSGRLFGGTYFGILIVPKVPNFLGVFHNFFERLLRNCE